MAVGFVVGRYVFFVPPVKENRYVVCLVGLKGPSVRYRMTVVVAVSEEEAVSFAVHEFLMKDDWYKYQLLNPISFQI